MAAIVRVHTHDANGELEQELAQERQLQSHLYNVVLRGRSRVIVGNGVPNAFDVTKANDPLAKTYRVRYNPHDGTYICRCKDFVFRGTDKSGTPTLNQARTRIFTYRNSVNYWHPYFVREMPEDNTRGVIRAAFTNGCKHIIAVKRDFPINEN